MGLSKVDDIKKDIFKELKAADVDSSLLNEITMRIGGSLVKLVKVSDNPIDFEREIRNEYKEKLSEKLTKIGEIINQKMAEAMSIINAQKGEYERKEMILQDKLDKAVPMPEITYSHAKQGISVTRGPNRGDLAWHIRAVYWPKFVDRVSIDTRHVKKMVTPVVIVILTNGNKITSVTTRKMSDLSYFSHYHQASPDCWGSWRPPVTWTNTQDILNVARDVEAVLENINSSSVATNGPRGLPRLSTLQRNLVEIGDRPDVSSLASDMGRTGIGGDRARIVPNHDDDDDREDFGDDTWTT
jgi:hypothetical protein